MTNDDTFDRPSEASEQGVPSSHDEVAFALLEICDRLRSLLGPKLNRAFRDAQDAGEPPFGKLPLDQRVVVGRQSLELLLAMFADVVGEPVIDRLVQVQGNTPEAARDAVLSWVKLVTSLVERSHETITQRYTTRDFAEALAAIDPAVLQDALWAPDRARSDKDKRTLSMEHVFAIALSRSLIEQGHDLHKVRSAIATAFGADWEAIRKWEGSSRKKLGDEVVDRVFDAAKRAISFLPRSIGRCAKYSFNKLAPHIASALVLDIYSTLRVPTSFSICCKQRTEVRKSSRAEAPLCSNNRAARIYSSAVKGFLAPSSPFP